MRSEPRPPWLIRQENGALAEARTRALLMDRFWVLERSADIEGADLIIQRRLTDRSLLDRTPPRLGFIQTKFYSDVSTVQYVHREYVIDNQGLPRAEFFVLCHAGTEDRIRAFLLSAEEISDRFKLTPADHSKPNRFVLPGKDVLVQRFEIADRRSALDRIERALRDADFDKNRAFAAWAVPGVAESPPILPMYEEGIDNLWGDIPAGFQRIRDRAKKGSWELEEALEKLHEIQESRDPARVLAIAEEIEKEWGKAVSLPGDLFDEDFLSAVQHHKKRYEQLVKEGLLSTHAAMRRAVIERIINDVAPKMPLARNDVYELTTHFNPSTLGDLSHTSRFLDMISLWPQPMEDAFGRSTDMPNTIGILESSPGLVRAYLAPGRYAYKDLVKREWVDSAGPWEDRVRGVAASMAAMVMEEVLKNRFGA